MGTQHLFYLPSTELRWDGFSNAANFLLQGREVVCIAVSRKTLVVLRGRKGTS